MLSTTDFSFRVIISPSLEIVTNIRFYYGEDVDLEAFERRKKDLNEEINSIVDKVEGLDDFEKALYIHGLSSGLDASKFENNFVNLDSNLNVTYVCDGPIGTGSIIRFSNKQTCELVDEYTTVIFGDTNGDGWYDGQDAVTVSMIAGGMLTRERVGEAVWMAADCNHDGVIDQADVELLNQAGVLLSNVDQTKSTDELLETSAEYVEYLNLIDQQTDADSDEATEDNTEATENNEVTTELSLWNIIVKYFIALIKKIASVIKVF